MAELCLDEVEVSNDLALQAREESTVAVNRASMAEGIKLCVCRRGDLVLC